MCEKEIQCNRTQSVACVPGDIGGMNNRLRSTLLRSAMLLDRDGTYMTLRVSVHVQNMIDPFYPTYDRQYNRPAVVAVRLGLHGQIKH